MVKRRFSMVLMGTSMFNQLKKLEKKVKVVGNHHERWRCSILLMGTSSKYVVCSMFLAGICSIEELLGNFLSAMFDKRVWWEHGDPGISFFELFQRTSDLFKADLSKFGFNSDALVSGISDLSIGSYFFLRMPKNWDKMEPSAAEMAIWRGFFCATSWSGTGGSRMISGDQIPFFVGSKVTVHLSPCRL